MVIVELFFAFAKIGFTSFGGMSMIPLIMQEMQAHHWMTNEDLSNLIAIAEMTPGPLGINCATFAGTQTAGVLGGVAAVAGVLMPAYTLTFMVAAFYTKFYHNQVMTKVLSVIKPICIAMIATVIIELVQENYIPQMEIDWIACVIGVGILFLLTKKKVSVPVAIGTAALAGLIGYGVLPLLIK